MVRRSVILVGTRHMATCVPAAMRHYTDVVPASRKPCEASMTVIAGVGRLQSEVVACRPARGYPSVMAIRTLSGHRCSVVETRTKERGSIEVACLAGGISDDVGVGLRGRHHASAQRMTTVASPGCAFEQAGAVACHACRGGVPAVKRKTGGCVIEIAA